MAIDVTVLGAGIFGLSCAWTLVRRGARVQVIDPLGVGGGASGGIVGALAPHVPEAWNSKKAFQLESLLMAEHWWAEVQTIGGGDPGYARTGRLQPIPDAAALTRAAERGAGAATLWPASVGWQIEDAQASWSPPSPTGKVIRDTLSARIHPAQACAALGQAVLASGATIRPNGEVMGAVLHATGWRGLSEMQTTGGQDAGCGIKGQAALLDLDRRDAPQLFVDGLHIVPHADGTTAIGSTSEREFTDEAPDALLTDILDRAYAAMPALRDAPVTGRWAGIRPRARSRAPLLGKWPARSGHYVANGGFKIGFGMAPKVADVIADLILDGRDTIPDAFATHGLAPWGQEA